MRISAPPAFSLSPSRFHCRLASQPDHLVPASFVNAESKTDSIGSESQINADVVFTHDAELPAQIASDAQSLENFALRDHRLDERSGKPCSAALLAGVGLGRGLNRNWRSKPLPTLS